MPDNKEQLKSLIKGIYEKENPEKAGRLNDDVYNKIIESYDGDYKSIVKNIYSRENPDKAKRLNDDVFKNIANAYNLQFDEKVSEAQPTPPGNITIPESSRIAYKHNNPGNLMYAGQTGAKKGEPKAGGGYWAEFDTPQAGFEGIVEDIKAKQAGKSRTGLGPDSTVEEYISTYAPPTENDTQRYVENFTKFLNVDKGTKLSEIDPVEAAKFIAKIESSTVINPVETKEEKVLSEPKKETDRTYTSEEIENLEALDRQPTSLAYADTETRNKYVEYKRWKEATKYTITPEDREQAKHTLDYIGAMEEETGQQLEEVEKELQNKYAKVPSWAGYQFSMPGTVQQQPWTYEAEMSDPLAQKRENLFQKKRLIDETKRYYRSVANGNKSAAIDRFWEGIKTFDVSNFVFLGINDMIGDIDIAQIYSKAEKQGIESLSQEEKDVIVLDNIRKQAQETAMKDRAFAVGSGIAETAPFIADMVVTSGVGTAIRKSAFKAGTAITSSVKTKAMRKVVANLSDATVRSLMFPSTYGMAAERTQADVAFDEEGEPMIVEGTGEPIGEAILKGAGSNVVEIIAEQWLGKGLSNVTTRLTKKGIPILKNTKVGEVFRAVDNAAKNSPIKKMAAIQDPITEFGEEVFAGIMQPIVTGDGSPLDFFERENMIRTALTVSIISYGMSAPSSVKGIHNLYKKNQGEKVYRELDENGRAMFDAAAEAETVDEMQESIRSIQDNMLTSESTIPEIKEANRKTMRLINYLSAVKKATHEAGKIKGASYQLGDRVYTDKARFFELLEKSLEKDNPVPFVKINNDTQAQQDLDNIFGTVERKLPETVNTEAKEAEKVTETKTEKAGTETVDETETPESSQKVEPGAKVSEQKKKFSNDEIENNFLVELNSEGKLEVNPVNTSELIYDNKVVLEFSRFNKGDRKEIELQDISSFEKSKGAGSDALSKIIEVADRLGYKITLNAKKFGSDKKSLSTLQLVDFYKKNGFKVDWKDAYGGDFKSESELLDYIRRNPDESVPMSRESKTNIENAEETTQETGEPVSQEGTEGRAVEESGVRDTEQDREAEGKINAVSKKLNVKPKNIRDVYRAGREIFGLNRVQSLAQAVVTDRIIGKIAKKTGQTKDQIYGQVEFQKSKQSDLSPAARTLYQVVWHGSPHAFEKFMLDKIGTGEGVQAFGWGLYFTDKKKIAKGYASIGEQEVFIKVNGKWVDILDTPLSKYEFELWRNKKIIKKEGVAPIINKFKVEIEARKKDYEREKRVNKNFANLSFEDSFFGKVAKELQDAIDFLETNPEIGFNAERNLYKVKLHGERSVDEFNYLRWDKEVPQEQVDKIIEQLKSEGRWDETRPVTRQIERGRFHEKGSSISTNQGRGLYSVLSTLLGSQKEASLLLLRAGIDGVKYPTEITRKGTHEESFNYVIFDENVAEIEEHIQFQKSEEGQARGAISFAEDGSAIIHALTDPNVSTPLHEVAHLYERYMDDAERNTVLKWAGEKEWTTETSEKFARGFEKYLAEGKAPTAELTKVFERFKEWLTEIYEGITGSEIDVKLNTEMRNLYDSILTTKKGEDGKEMQEQQVSEQAVQKSEDKTTEKSEKTPEGTQEKKRTTVTGRRIRTVSNFLSDLKNAVTRKNAERKAKEIVKRKQAELDKDMKEFLPKEIEKIERNGLVVEHTARGEKGAKRYHVKRKPDGTYSVVSMFDRDASDRPKRVTNKRLRDAILSKYRKQRKADIAEIERAIEEKYLQETEDEINAVVDEYKEAREQAEPTATTEFSEKEGKPTKPAEGKKRREKKPSEGTKVVVDEAAALKDEIRTWTSQAREQKAFTEAEFSELTGKIREKLKEGVDNKHINRGQYKAIINRLGNASTPKRRQKLLDYVDNVLDGSEYKGLVAEANKHIEKVKKANKKDKSKFGDAAALATDFTKIDPKQLTPEELRQFNLLAEKIMKNRKAPSISYMEAAVSKFSDNYREDYDAFAAKIDKAKEEGTLDDLAVKLKKELNDDIAESEELFKKKNLKTAQDYIKAERKLRAARKKANRLIDEGLMDKAEAEALIGKLGDQNDISGEWEDKLSQFKEDYAEVLSQRKKDPAVRDGLSELTEQEREAYGQLLSATKEQLAKLKMVDLEAFSNVIDNLEDGYAIPEAMQLRRALDSLAKRDSFLSAAVKNIFSSNSWGKRLANNLKGLSDIISSTKSHRLDLILGNTSKYNTINAIYSSVARAIQKESNFNKKFEERRIKILNDFHKGFLTPAERLLMKASPSSRLGKKATPERIAQIRDKANNKIREVQNFLIERSWQQEDSFKNGDVNEKNASILSARYNEGDPLNKGVPDREMENFFKERERWLTQFNEAKKNGLTKKVNGVEVIDIDKYEQWLRKDKAVAKLIDEHDKYYEEIKPYVKVATMENGRTFLEKQKYTPFRGRVTGGKVDVNDIKTEIEGGIINPKMQANSTYNRKGAIQWLENDMFKVMESHTREAMRNYFVYPESRASLEALRQAFNEYSKKNPENKEQINSLRDALMNDLKNRAARYYNSGKYKIEYDPVFDRWLKGAKKGMLVNPARVPAEMIANLVRATIALGGMPTKALTMDRKDKIVFDSLMKEYISDKYWSRYSPEIGGISTKRTVVSKLEEGADWIITVSDKAVGRPLMRHEFMKAFKEMTGKDFDVDRYVSDGQYAIDNKGDIHKAATWAVRRLEELFNDKSVLTTPQLTKFVAGAIKADPNRSTTKLFDLFQSFNRNEVDQLRDAGRRIASGDTQLVQMGGRDMFAVMTSNVLYQVLRRAAGITVSMGIASLLGQDLTDYEEEEKEMLLSMERLLKDARRAELGLLMGGSANIYGYAARIGMFVFEKTDILKEEQKEYIYQIMVDDLYGRKIPEWGSPQSALTATLPVPSTAINDAFKGADGLGSLLSSLHKAVEAGQITEKEMWEVVSLINLGFKYFAPNPITPTAQKTIDRQIREARDEGKKKSGSSSTVRPGRSTPSRPDRNSRPDRAGSAPSRPNR